MEHSNYSKRDIRKALRREHRLMKKIRKGTVTTEELLADSILDDIRSVIDKKFERFRDELLKSTDICFALNDFQFKIYPPYIYIKDIYKEKYPREKYLNDIEVAKSLIKKYNYSITKEVDADKEHRIFFKETEYPDVSNRTKKYKNTKKALSILMKYFGEHKEE